ncbi:hypothetical protein CEXT_510051 [Caerostris extrusa]|uniref:Uncharacterized protein n=1 Tax=Caerostris extrusa TaxID=172846 RepID=A0AAV4UY64_CAEEX|nr:hypothetical protein CEXT_510051 [Caerostris extrusa]
MSILSLHSDFYNVTGATVSVSYYKQCKFVYRPSLYMNTDFCQQLRCLSHRRTTCTAPCYSSHDLFQLFTLFIKLKSASCMKSAAPQEVEAFAEAANELMTQLMMTMKCRPRDTKNCRFFLCQSKDGNPM